MKDFFSKWSQKHKRLTYVLVDKDTKEPLQESSDFEWVKYASENYQVFDNTEIKKVWINYQLAGIEESV